ncbi:hypothetical protein [Aurantimonas endophytica]|uniref:Uncharacterized protein n=1 Tax=Aurantimonas endophytica TaxID=1522175 RepID=A0A7W6HCF0_9HYPH|nr:hypothetical protein [Aurantimonas endophytica]MBB4002654.1 hypothetical protein [Aurantimonas endophytica]MCO6403534.1 hypothetical protein [Aurantimonas endophytica]
MTNHQNVAAPFRFDVGQAVQTACGSVRGKVRYCQRSSLGTDFYVLRYKGRDRSLRGKSLIAA